VAKNKQSEGQVRLVKMTCGNTVIATVHEQGDTFKLTKPMEVVLMPGRGNQTMITLMDFVPGADQEVIPVRKDHVVCRVKADEKILQLYEQVTNPSPIATPGEKKLVLPPG